MFFKIKLTPHETRKSTHFALNDKNVPEKLFTVKNKKPDLEGFPYPLPCRKSEYTLFAKQGEISWYGSNKGLTRCNPKAKYDFDRVMYFSADRDLLDNCVKAILPDGTGAWVLTETGVTHIELPLFTPGEIAKKLTDETHKYVDRHGMVSQRKLLEPRNFDSAVPYGHSDNDGGFTAGYAMGEIFKYAYFKREKGIDAPETLEAKRSATRAVEACLLLMYIHGRQNGFVARTYLSPTEPVPDDGLFFKREGNIATVLDTTYAREKGLVGATCDCSYPIPERLRHLMTDEGFTEDGCVYKADTSSDETTLHVLMMYFAHEYLTCDDLELDEILIDALERFMTHVLDSGYVLADFMGEGTTWGKWNFDYFHTHFGYVDGALNSAQILFYLRAVMHITGEEGRWLEEYNHLAYDLGYLDLCETHYDKLTQVNILMGVDLPEDIMYGDHMLACCAFLGLCLLEKDEESLKKFRNGFKAWRTSIAREHTVGYDFMYLLACPDETIDEERAKEWFYRHNLSRLAAGVSLVGRHDVPVKEYMGGYKETSWLLPPDERFISKYDRNPLEYKNEDSGGMTHIESCYVYTFAYWMGKFFGFVEGED